MIESEFSDDMADEDDKASVIIVEQQTTSIFFQKHERGCTMNSAIALNALRTTDSQSLNNGM